jgi:hypothetical protein
MKPVKKKNPNKSHPGKAGRKPIAIDWKLVEQLCHIQCTGPEIASVTGIDQDTFTNRCKKDNNIEFSDYIKKHAENGYASLKRRQWKTAIEEGNVTMQIWLGKQYLGQSDKNDIDHTSKGEKIFDMQAIVKALEKK